MLPTRFSDRFLLSQVQLHAYVQVTTIVHQYFSGLETHTTLYEHCKDDFSFFRVVWTNMECPVIQTYI